MANLTTTRRDDRRELIDAHNLTWKLREELDAVQAELQAERDRLPLLVRGLVDALPSVGSEWAVEDRRTWLEALRMNLDLIYQPQPSG